MASKNSSNFITNLPTTLKVFAAMGVVLLLIVGLFVFRMLTSPRGGWSESSIVKTQGVTVKTIPITYQTVGTLEAQEQVDLNSEIPGTVAKIYFQEGQWVKAGQPLLQLKPDKQYADVNYAQAGIQQSQAGLISAQAQLDSQAQAVLQAKAQYTLAQNEYTRYQSLFQQEFISAQDLDAKKAALDVAQAGFQSAVKQQAAANARVSELRAMTSASQAQFARSASSYGDTMIRAPFSGQVGQKYVDKGDYVLMSEKLVTLVNAQSMKVAVNLPEKYRRQVKKGSVITVTSESLPGKTIQGKVLFIDPVVSPDTLTFTVKAQLENPESFLEPGQYVSVQVQLGQKSDAILLPEQAIVAQGERYYVYVQVADPKNKQNIAKQVFVELGQRIPGFVEALTGITPADKVVVAGVQKVQDGTPLIEQSDLAKKKGAKP